MTKAMLCLILDRSGSMSGKENDVIGGVNNFIAEQQKVPDEATISLVRFDTEYEEFRPSAPLSAATPITAVDYQPRGSTALLDAVGRTLNSLDVAWKQHQPDRAIVVVVTDGEENSSREFTLAQIKDMIESREKSGKWSFIYLGAGPNAFADAGRMGFSHGNTASYVGTAQGTQTAYHAATHSVREMRTSGSLSAGLGRALAEDEKDAQQAQPQPAPTPTPAQQPLPDVKPWQEPGRTWSPPQP